MGSPGGCSSLFSSVNLANISQLKSYLFSSIIRAIATTPMIPYFTKPLPETWAGRNKKGKLILNAFIR
jgi:hypothetical protein